MNKASSPHAGARIAVVSLYSVENLGARAIHAWLKARGWVVDLILVKEYALNRFETITEEETRLLVDLFRERGVTAIGMSVRSPYVLAAGKLSRALKEALGAPVIWGGVAPTVTPGFCLDAGADYIIRGEGEEAFEELLIALHADASPCGISNVGFRADEETTIAPIRPLIAGADLDALPFPDFNDEGKFLLRDGRVIPGEPMRQARRYEMIASRGCPYACSYCANSVLREIHKGAGWRSRPYGVPRVIAELEHAKAMLPGLRSVFFMDEVFSVREDWAVQFSRQYHERIALQFECQCDPRTVNASKLALLKDAGLVEMTIGIQSGCEIIRREVFNRHVADSEILNAAQLLAAQGIPARYDVITDNPYEDSDAKRATLHLLLRLPRPYILNLWSLFYLPEATLTRRALQEGRIMEADIVGMSDESVQHFTVSLRRERPPEDAFWVSLYTLASKPLIPACLVSWLSRRSFLCRHPLPLLFFARLATTIRVLAAGTWLLLTGRIDLGYALRQLRSLDGVAR